MSWFYKDVFNRRNLSLVDELISPTFINHNASIHVRGPEGIKRFVMAQFQAFPDIHTAIDDIITEGDKVVVRARDCFTPQTNGKTVEMTWIETLRLENGKLVEACVEADMRPLDQLAGEYK